MLKTWDDCADRIEAAALYFDRYTLTTYAERVRRGQIDVLALSQMRREAERLVEGLKSLDRLVAGAQGRAQA